MQTYDWSCLACNMSNGAGAACCSQCACPARATVPEVERHRESFAARGGTPAAHHLSEPFPWSSVYGLFPTALAILLAWLLLTSFSPISIVLIDLVTLLGSGWLRGRLVGRPTARATVRASALAVVFSPGLIGGHGVMVAPASVGVFFWPLPNAVSLSACFLLSLVLCARAEKLALRPNKGASLQRVATGGSHEA